MKTLDRTRISVSDDVEAMLHSSPLGDKLGYGWYWGKLQ